MSSLQQGFPQLAQRFVDPQTGILQQPWYNYLLALWNRTGSGPGISSADLELIQVMGAAAYESSSVEAVQFADYLSGVPQGSETFDTGLALLLSALGNVPAADLPIGFATPALTSEALAQWDFVNLYDNAGTATVRKADATDPAKFANGFVIYAAANASTAMVYAAGVNKATVSTPAAEVWLSVTVPGGFQTTAPTTAGQIVQTLGSAVPGYGVAYAYSTPVELT